MSTRIEQELRELFVADAGRTTSAGLPDVARTIVRRRRTMRASWGVATLAAGSAIVFGVASIGNQSVDSQDVLQATPPDSVTGRALPGGNSGRCVEKYTSASVANRSFAFDGTVTSIGPGSTDRNDQGLGYVSVTFLVHEWFTGGSNDTVTVDVASPDWDANPQTAPSFAVGSRLLVSGEPRWGGEPLEAAVAWGCGFTRYFDDTTATAWRATTSDGLPR
jgi:hypothetical protein